MAAEERRRKILARVAGVSLEEHQKAVRAPKTNSEPPAAVALAAMEEKAQQEEHDRLLALKLHKEEAAVRSDTMPPFAPAAEIWRPVEPTQRVAPKYPGMARPGQAPVARGQAHYPSRIESLLGASNNSRVAAPGWPVGVDSKSQEALEMERAIALSLETEKKAEAKRQAAERKRLEEERRRRKEERKQREMAALRERSAANEKARAAQAAADRMAADQAAVAKAHADKASEREAAHLKAAALAAAADRARNGLEFETETEMASSSDGSYVAGPTSDDDLTDTHPRWWDEKGVTDALHRKTLDAGVSAKGMQGIRVGEWANCELLQPMLTALLPEKELDAAKVVALDIATAQLLKLADADQQCEAIIDGPQCEPMRKRMMSAELILALINDNDDPSASDGGSHWSLAVMRRSRWKNGTFVVEHCDPSGDAEINHEAAKQFTSALAERLSELCKQPADRIEVHRIAVPAQHDGATCGLTSLCYAKQTVEAHREALEAGEKKPPIQDATKNAMSCLNWAIVESVRRAAARAWMPEVVDETLRYKRELRGLELRAAICTAKQHVVFDLYDEEGDSEGFDELQTDEPSKASTFSASAIAIDEKSSDMYDFLKAFSLLHLTKPLLQAGLKMEHCVTSVGDRTTFLEQLRMAGIDKLTDRQALTNALSKAVRTGTLKPPYKGPFTIPAQSTPGAPRLQPRYPTQRPSLAW